MLVLEDEHATRERIVRLLDGARCAIDVAWAGDTGGAALAWLDRGMPVDVALVDLGLPDIAGSDAVRAMVRARPGLAVVALTIFDDEPTVRAVLSAGAAGYLLKPVRREPLVDAIIAAAAGGAPMTAYVARIVLDAWKLESAAAGAEQRNELTRRERDVLGLLARGLTYSAVAAELGIGLGTVQGYVKSIYGKLQVNSKAEARARARQFGIT
ncbi:MAG: response regulator transcription factor [Labilithrix sp.]|nr:response regulator transcription factor [Labilithrix sp.]